MLQPNREARQLIKNHREKDILSTSRFSTAYSTAAEAGPSQSQSAGENEMVDAEFEDVSDNAKSQ
jgi:hypothetical protein